MYYKNCSELDITTISHLNNWFNSVKNNEFLSEVCGRIEQREQTGKVRNDVTNKYS